MSAQERFFYGIDPGVANVAVASIAECCLHVETRLLISKSKEEERLVEVENFVNGIVLRSPRLIALEGYSYGARNYAHQMGEVGGIIRRSLFLAEVDFFVVPPTLLKKFVCSKGSAKKDEMKLWAFKRWLFEADSSDEIDAFVLAKLAQCLYCVQSRVNVPDLNAQQEEVIAKCLPKLKQGSRSRDSHQAQIETSSTTRGTASTPA